MPSSKKVAWSQLKVGIVAAVAMVILAVLLFLMTGDTRFFQDRANIYTYLPDSAALTKGSDVRLNGILIGKITSVDLSNEPDLKRAVRVEMEIDSDRLKQIPTDSLAGISAANVLGTKYINIKRGTAAQTVAPGGQLKSKDTSDYEQVVEQGYSFLASAEEMLKRVDNLVKVIERGEGSIGKLVKDPQLYDNLNGTAAEARKIVAQLNTGKGTISRLMYDEVLHDDIRTAIARTNSLLEGIQQGQGTAGKLLKDQALYDDMRKTIAEVRTLMADLNAGKGTMGKFLKDEAFHQQLQATIGRMDTLLDKINTGQGTLGQMVVNPQLYESLNGTSREFHDFMKDFRKNPKKFLSIKLSLF
jgi:phospholipid/cholesterol/gamma-HCH transport system substrate-binding protein